MNITEIHEMKSANVSQAKKIWDARYNEDEKKMTLEKAVKQGMFKIENLKDNVLYFGYSPKGIEATWNEKRKKFVMLLGGLPVTAKHYDEFIPTTSEDQLQEAMPKSKEELLEELTKVTMEMEKVDDILKGSKIKLGDLHQKRVMVLNQIDRTIRKEIADRKK